MNNIIMIGMPASGKSTLGVLLAKYLGKKFLDVDLLIQEKENMLLQEIINKKGNEYFKKIEEKVLFELSENDTVISPGGSAVYYHKSMSKLKKNSLVVYIKVPFHEIEKRLNNITSRGITLKEGQTLKSLFDERSPLYEQYADIVIDVEDISIEETLDKIIRQLKTY